MLEQWCATMRGAGRSPKTIKVRIGAIIRLCQHAGITNPLDVTPIQVAQFLGSPDLADWSRLTYWRSIVAFTKFIQSWHDKDYDPIAGLDRPGTPDPVARPISDRDVELLMSAPMWPRTRQYIDLALFEALRVHEIAKIRGEDFDIEAGYLRVLGKKKVHKLIPLHPRVVRLAQTMPKEGWWFPSPIHPGQPVGAGNVSTVIAKQMRALGINATAHQLRDTAATRLQRRTHDLRMTQEFLRHKSVSSTQKYVGVDAEEMRNAIGSMWEDDEWQEAA